MNSKKAILDALLVTEFKAGNKKALSLLVKRWHSQFCKQANWYLKDQSLAKDVAQESWVVIIRKIHTLNNAERFAPWALRIVHRKAIDQLRRAKKVQTFGATEIEQLAKPEDYNSDRLTKIDLAIMQLPVKQRMVLELFYKNELSLDQIAEVLKISRGTVKSRLFYARETIKQQLKQ